MNAPVLTIKPEQNKQFVEEVVNRSGQTLTACYQCRRCAAGCPVGIETGYITPDRLIRAILLGDKELALSNELVWKCVSCYTCGVRCPNDIQTARITESLKKMAKAAHHKPLLPKVAAFHDAFVKSSIRWGRVNEMEFMGFYEIKNTFNFLKQLKIVSLFAEIAEQTKVALGLLKRKRMHFGLQSVRGRKELKRLLKTHRQKKI